MTKNLKTLALSLSILSTVSASHAIAGYPATSCEGSDFVISERILSGTFGQKISAGVQMTIQGRLAQELADRGLYLTKPQFDLDNSQGFQTRKADAFPSGDAGAAIVNDKRERFFYYFKPSAGPKPILEIWRVRDGFRNLGNGVHADQDTLELKRELDNCHKAN